MRIGTIYGDVFAERVIGNLINFKTFCEGCEPVCSECRSSYGSFVGDIVGIHPTDPPSPTMIEDPEEVIKNLSLTPCDLLLIVAIHHDILAAVDLLVEATGAKAVLVPIEDPTWVPPGLRAQVKETLDNLGIENAFPKPFCTLEPGEGKLIDEFIKTYRVGSPVHERRYDPRNWSCSVSSLWLYMVCKPKGSWKINFGQGCSVRYDCKSASYLPMYSLYGKGQRIW